MSEIMELVGEDGKLIAKVPWQEGLELIKERVQEEYQRVREACAAEVEAAGCRCGLEGAQREAVKGKDYGFAEFIGGERLVAYLKERDAALAKREHEPWCPIALAAKLREMGR